MQNMIANSTQHINNHSSVVGKLTTRLYTQKANWLPEEVFKKTKAIHHAKAKAAISHLKYRVGIKATLAALINLSDKNGASKASQARLAYNVGCSTKTIERHLQRLHKDGVIYKIQNGRQQVNTYILLFIELELPDRTDKMSAYLNPSERSQKASALEGVQEQEIKRVEARADTRPPQEEDIFDDEIDFEPKLTELTDEEREKSRLAMLKCMGEVSELLNLRRKPKWVEKYE